MNRFPPRPGRFPGDIYTNDSREQYVWSEEKGWELVPPFVYPEEWPEYKPVKPEYLEKVYE